MDLDIAWFLNRATRAFGANIFKVIRETAWAMRHGKRRVPG
jgi:hypothetical protein